MQTSSAGSRTPPSTLVLFASAMMLIFAIAITSFLAGMAFQARHYSQTGTMTVQSNSGTSAAPHVVFHQAGNGEASTKTFSVGDTWTLALKCSGVSSGIGGSAPIYISAYDTSGTPTLDDLAYNLPEGKGGSTSSVFHDTGTIYLKIISDINWDVTVTD